MAITGQGVDSSITKEARFPRRRGPNTARLAGAVTARGCRPALRSGILGLHFV